MERTRLSALLATLLLAVALGGCIGTGDDSPPSDDADDNGGDDTMGNETMEPVVPNQPPVLAVSIVNDTGAETTTVLQGGNLTFDAGASADADGSIAAISLTVTDGAGTRTFALATLGNNTPARVPFHAPGLATATFAALDNDGDIVSNTTIIGVHHPQEGTPYEFRAPHDGDLLAADACAGHDAPGAGGVLDAQWWNAQPFQVMHGATSIEAVIVQGAAQIAICDADGNALSESADGQVTSTPGAALNASSDYFVSVVSGFNTDAPDNSPFSNTVQVDVLVRYG